MTLPKSPNFCLSIIVKWGDRSCSTNVSCFNSECLIAFSKQSLPSGLVLAESHFLSGWLCGFATWQKPPEDDWSTPLSWRGDLARVIPNGCGACQNAGSAELWSSTGLGLKQRLCITHHPKKASRWPGAPFLDLGRREMLLSCSCFLRDFPLQFLSGIFLLFK